MAILNICLIGFASAQIQADSKVEAAANRREARSLLTKAIDFYNERQYSKALSQVRKAIDSDPVYSRNYLWLGEIHYRMKQRRQATAAWRKALGLAPKRKNDIYRDDARNALQSLGRVGYPTLNLYDQKLSIPLRLLVVDNTFQVLGDAGQFASAIGLTYRFDAATGKAMFKLDDDVITLQNGSRYLYRKNNKNDLMPLAAQREGNVLYVPLRSVAEAVGAQVKWDEDEGILRLEDTPLDPNLKILPAVQPLEKTERPASDSLVIMNGFDKAMTTLTFSSDARWLIGGGSSQVKFEPKKVRGKICLWEARTGRLERTLIAHYAPISALAISQNANLLASGSFDGSVGLWDFKTHRRHMIPVDPNAKTIAFGQNTDVHEAIMELSFSKDGEFLVYGLLDGTIYFVNTSTKKVIKKFQLSAQSTPIRSVRTYNFNWAQNLIATTHDNGMVCLWDLNTGRLINTISFPGSDVKDATFSQNSSHLLAIAAGYSVSLYDVLADEEKAKLSVEGVALSRVEFASVREDDTTTKDVVFAYSNTGKFVIWDGTSDPAPAFSCQASANFAVASANGIPAFGTANGDVYVGQSGIGF